MLAGKPHPRRERGASERGRLYSWRSGRYSTTKRARRGQGNRKGCPYNWRSGRYATTKRARRGQGNRKP
jgi:hypothetical protein